MKTRPLASETAYCAFVSYRHSPSDRNWAVRIARFIEEFRLPNQLVQNGFPKRLGKVFRDDDELSAGGELSERLRTALESSEYLLVICSPATNGSLWIAREIEVFQKQGRSDRIIPIVVEGDPDEVVPHQLRTKDDQLPIAVDLRKQKGVRLSDTYQRGMIRIAAAVAGCTFDDLKRRMEKRKKDAQRQKVAIACAVLSVGLIASGYFHDRFFALKSYYSADFVEHLGVPAGVGQLRPEQIQARCTSFKITTRGGRTERMERVNSLGKTARPDNSCLVLSGRTEIEGVPPEAVEWNYEYSANGDLQSVRVSEVGGREISEARYTFSADKKAAVVTFQADLGVADMQTGEASGRSSDIGESIGRTEIAQHRLEFDDEGRLRSRRFERLGGLGPGRDSLGAYGRRYSYAENGQLIELASLNINGDDLIGKTGVVVTRVAYDDSGNAVALSFHDSKGALIAGDENYARIEAVLDKFGNEVRRNFLDANGAAIVAKTSRVSSYETILDESGFLVESRALGVDGKPAARMPAGWSIYRVKYDRNGRVNRIELFDAQGKPIRSRTSDGEHARSFERDDLGRVVAISFWDESGLPTLSKEGGLHRTSYTLDALGRTSAVAFEDARRQPVVSRDQWCASLSFKYDKFNNIADRKCFGADGAPAANINGIHRIKCDADDKGNISECRFYGVDGQRAFFRNYGHSGYKNNYNERGNLVSFTYIGADDQAFLNSGVGYATMRATFNSMGLRERSEFFGANDQPVRAAETGCHDIRRIYDELGRKTKEACFDETGHPSVFKSLGVHEVSNSYDDRSNPVSTAYFDVDGSPMLDRDDGVARIERTLNKAGQVVEAKWFDVDGSPKNMNRSTISRQTLMYNESNQVIEIQQWDATGAGGGDRNCPNASIVRSKYDIAGNEIETAYFDLLGLPTQCLSGVHRVVRTFDDFNNKTEDLYIGVDGVPEPGLQGFIGARWTYDAFGREKKAEFVGPDYKPFVYERLGYAAYVYGTDESNQTNSMSFLDANGKPAIFRVQGCARLEWDNDEYGRNSEDRCIGPDGSGAVQLLTGAEITRYEYPDASTTISSLLDAQRRPRVGQAGTVNDGVHRIVEIRDSSGRMTSKSFFGISGEPSVTGLGYAAVKFERDLYGRAERVNYFGITGTPIDRLNRLFSEDQMLKTNDDLTDLLGSWRAIALNALLTQAQMEAINSGGFASVLQKFNHAGDIVERRYLGANGKPAVGPNGFSVERFSFDVYGRLVEISFDREGPTGISAIRLHYSEPTRVHQITFVGQGGTLVADREGVTGFELAYNSDGTLVGGTPIR